MFNNKLLNGGNKMDEYGMIDWFAPADVDWWGASEPMYETEEYGEE